MAQRIIERQLPCNIEAEKGILGSIIIDPEAITLIGDLLSPVDFYRDAHRVIFEAIMHLYEQEEPADFITLCDELERRNQLQEAGCEQMGGASYISSLANGVPTSGNIEYYARIVKETAILRSLIGAGGKIVEWSYNEKSAEVALEKSQQLLYEIGQGQSEGDFTSAETLVDGYLDKLCSMRKSSEEQLAGLSTGFPRLDYLTGGFQKTDLIILAARPGVGKSSWALSVAYHAAINEGKRVGIFTLEMGKEQWIQRLISIDTGIPTHRLRTMQIRDEEWPTLMASRERLATSTLQINDVGGISIATLRSKALRAHAKHPFDLFIVDYIQLVKGTNKDRVLEIGEISMGLKNMAKELNVPVLALAQLSRAVENRQVKIPQLSDLRESGSLENDADIVAFIYRDEIYNPESPRKGIADIIIAKHRNGPTGEVQLGFIKEQTLFVPLTEERTRTLSIVPRSDEDVRESWEDER